MLREEARKKLCPMMSARKFQVAEEGKAGIIHCFAEDCAIWEDWQTTQEHIGKHDDPPEGEGWDNKGGGTYSTRWVRDTPLNEIHGGCGLATKESNCNYS